MPHVLSLITFHYINVHFFSPSSSARYFAPFISAAAVSGYDFLDIGDVRAINCHPQEEGLETSLPKPGSPRHVRQR